MRVFDHDAELAALLRTADGAFPPPQCSRLEVATLQRLGRRQLTRRGLTIGAVAAAVLFAALTSPGLGPVVPARDSMVTEQEIIALTRQADLMQHAAFRMERDRSVVWNTNESASEARIAEYSAAAESAAFVVFCEADRLATNAEPAAARERYSALQARFPGTVWARIAGQFLSSTRPTEKG